MYLACAIFLQLFRVVPCRRSWQRSPNMFMFSQSGSKSGRHSPYVTHDLCGYQISQFENQNSAVVDARVATLPIRVAGASAKMDGTQETQWSNNSQEPGCHSWLCAFMNSLICVVCIFQRMSNREPLLEHFKPLPPRQRSGHGRNGTGGQSAITHAVSEHVSIATTLRVRAHKTCWQNMQNMRFHEKAEVGLVSGFLRACPGCWH